MSKLFLWSIIFLFQNNWTTFTDVYETFSIQIPGSVETIQDKFVTSIGEIEIITYKSKGLAEDPNLSYVLQEYDYPENYFPQDSQALIRRVLVTSCEEMAEKMRGKIDYKRQIDFNGYNGLLFRITNKESEIVMKSKTYIINGTYYSLQVYTKMNKSLNDEMDYFLDSFKILE